MHGPNKKPTADLIALLDRLTALAHEAAAAPDADEEHRGLPDVAEELCGAVAVEAQIVRDYGRMTMWLTDVLPRLSAADRSSFAKLGLGPFIPGGVVHLQNTLLAAVHIVSLVSNDPALQAELAKLREKLDARLKARQDKAAEIKKPVWQLQDSGRTAKEIEGDLAKTGPRFERSRGWIYETIAERKRGEPPT
jgi:hypothetical protein